MIDSELAPLFARASGGDREALDEIFGVVYPALKRIARGYLYRERQATLQTTALVNEAWLKLAASPGVDCNDRRHFLTLAARSMRQVLVDYARSRNAGKRGADAEKLSYLTEHMANEGGDTRELLRLDDALTALEAHSPRQATLVNLRYFAGLSIEEAADVLDISPATVKREWNLARLWLLDELQPD